MSLEYIQVLSPIKIGNTVIDTDKIVTAKIVTDYIQVGETRIDDGEIAIGSTTINDDNINTAFLRSTTCVFDKVQIGSELDAPQATLKIHNITADNIQTEVAEIDDNGLKINRIQADVVESKTNKFTNLDATNLTFNNDARIIYNEYKRLQSNVSLEAPDFTRFYTAIGGVTGDVIDDQSSPGLYLGIFTGTLKFSSECLTYYKLRDLRDFITFTWEYKDEHEDDSYYRPAKCNLSIVSTEIVSQNNDGSFNIKVSGYGAWDEQEVQNIVIRGTAYINVPMGLSALCSHLSALCNNLSNRLDTLGFSGAQDIKGTVTVGGEDKKLTIGKVAVLGKIVYGYIYSGGLIKQIHNLNGNVKDLRNISKMTSIPGPINMPVSYSGIVWFGDGDMKTIDIVNTGGALDFTTNNVTGGELIPLHISVAFTFAYSLEEKYNIYEN